MSSSHPDPNVADIPTTPGPSQSLEAIYPFDARGVAKRFRHAAIFGALLFRQHVWKLLFGHAFVLPDRVWTILAVRWGIFFIFMAGINEAIRLTQTTDFWVNSRLFIGFPLVFLFMMANLPITLKNIGKENAPAPEAGGAR